MLAAGRRFACYVYVLYRQLAFCNAMQTFLIPEFQLRETVALASGNGMMPPISRPAVRVLLPCLNAKLVDRRGVSGVK